MDGHCRAIAPNHPVFNDQNHCAVSLRGPKEPRNRALGASALYRTSRPLRGTTKNHPRIAAHCYPAEWQNPASCASRQVRIGLACLPANQQ